MLPQQEWKLVYYVTPAGKIPFQQWLESLTDDKARAAIESRMTRLQAGNFGTCEPVGYGVFELKIYYGPGYRVYFGRKGKRVILLLCGGDKSTQGKDIQTARHYWRDFEKRKQT